MRESVCGITAPALQMNNSTLLKLAKGEKRKENEVTLHYRILISEATKAN